ncbi:Tenascin [Frankliniella fusca]|uniref:Tenascin n=1 Tax=Frankliniella fusca TaxID=407009 RepID=A0AAE1HQB5_9NEOP|nr:Tenascin [Frankliniella fusca]
MKWLILFFILPMARNGRTAGTTSKSPFCQFEESSNRGKRLPCPTDVGLNCEAKLFGPEQICGNLNFSTSLFGGQVSLHQDESLSLTDVIIKPYTFQRSSARKLCGFSLEYQARKGNDVEMKRFTFKLPHKADTNSTNPEILVAIQHTVECVQIHWASSHENISIFRVKLYEINSMDHVPVKDAIINRTKYEFCGELKPYTQYNVSIEGHISQNVWSQPFFSVPFSATKNTTKPKNCVIVYNPSSLKHITVIAALVKFLQCFMPVCYFESDFNINNNEIVYDIFAQTPADWWGRMLLDADLILVVSNPTLSDTECPGSILYPYFATGHLERCLAWNIQRKRKAIRILLPYCQKNSFYDFLKGCTPCYHILKDRFKLLQEILGPQNIYLPRFVASYHYSIYFHTEHWRRLEELLTSEISPNQELQPWELRRSISQSLESLHSNSSNDVNDDVVDNQIYFAGIQDNDSSESEDEELQMSTENKC